MKTSRKIYILTFKTKNTEGWVVGKGYYTNKTKALEKAISLNTSKEITYGVCELKEAGQSD